MSETLACNGANRRELGTQNSELAVVHVASGREWRGGQRQVCYLTRALNQEPGISQLVVTGRGTRLAGELERSGVRVSPAPWGGAFDLRVLRHLFRALREFGVGSAILHAHDSHALTLAALAAAWVGLPLVATRRVDFRLRQAWLWRRADRVVAISEAVRRVLLQCGLEEERLAVVPSGIPLDRPDPVRAMDLRSRLGLGWESRLAVGVGALVRHKDHATLVSAAARLRDRHPALHWVIAGDGPLRGSLERQIRDLGVEGTVHLIGEVPDGRAVIAAGDVFVVSSREEGLNTSVLDAMALGIPVVSTDAGGLPEALGGGAGLLCRAEDPTALAELVARVSDDPQLRHRLTTTARAIVGRFSSARMAASIVSVYHSVARAHGAHALSLHSQPR